MKRLTSSALFFALALALTAPLAHAGSDLTPAQKQAQKNFNSYNKQTLKAQKKEQKKEQKQMKQWKKQHQSTTTVT